jgi:alkylhydroperoxidase/carboxymuconolactone decarboxylase family protein YurZ
MTGAKARTAMAKRPPIPKAVESFSTSFASVWQAFQKLGDECHGAGPLDDRVRRLVKVGIAAAAQSEGAVHSAVRHAKAAGIPAAEIRHVIVLSITTIGFPRAMAAMSWADDILRK